MANKPTPQSLDTLSNGRTSSNVFLSILEDRDPNQFDVNYAVSQRWVNTALLKEWILISFTNQPSISNPYGLTVANWGLLSNEMPELIFLTGNDNVKVPATNNNIFILGAIVAAGTTPVFTSGNSSISTLMVNIQLSQAIASTNASNVGVAAFNSDEFSVDANGFVSLISGFADLHVAKWIVNAIPNAGGNQTSITAALTAASSGDTIFVMPGTYTENLTLKAGVNLVAFTVDGLTPNVTIIGTLTATFTGTSSISGIRLQTNGANFLQVTGANSTNINIYDCYFNCTNSSGILNSSSGMAILDIYRCRGDLGTTGINFATCSGNGAIRWRYCNFTNTGGSTTSEVYSGTNSAALGIFATYFPNNNFAISSSASVLIEHSTILNITLSNTASATIRWSQFETVTVNSGTICNLDHALTTNSSTNVVTGSGTVNYSNISFMGTSSNMNASSLIPQVSSNDAIKVVTPGAYPYTTTAQDALILVDTSSARTIIPLATPVIGQKHFIKDSVGSANTNNITITPSGKNIDGSASTIINIAYGSIEIVYNGTQWNIV